MNPKQIIVGSLVLNLALAGLALYVFGSPKAPAVSENPRSAIEEQPQKASEPSVPVREIQSTEIDSGNEFAWRELEAKDFKVYIANLRAVACPEETIRDIITAEVNKFYAKRFRALRQEIQPQHSYWQTSRNTWNTRQHYDQQKKIRTIEKEKSALLIELLGVDPNEVLKKDHQRFDYWERHVQFLPGDRREAVLEIQMKYVAQEQEIYQGGGMIDEEDQKKIRELYKQRMAELATIMTSQELNEYDLRASHTANQLRHDLEVFKPSENEFRQIFEIRKAREDDLAHVYDQDDKAGRERREKAVKETDEQIKAMLGDDRFAFYKRAPDWNYRELVRLVERQELPRENADKVYDAKKTIEDLASTIRSNKDLTPEQRTEALKTLRDEAEQSITEALGGEKGWKKYSQRQGWWLNNISPKKTS